MTRWSLALLILLLPARVLAEDPDADAILQRAFDRADRADAEFTPFRYHLESHSWIRDGDDELQQEERAWSDEIAWRPDSTQSLNEGKEVIFVAEEEEDEESEAEEEGKKKEESVEGETRFLSADMRGLYTFKPLGFTEQDGRRLAEYRLRSKKRKWGWKGTLLLDPDTGALVTARVEPSRLRFGLKKMKMQLEMQDFAGADAPRHIAMDIEAKLPLIFHMKIRTDLEFSDYRFVESAK